MIRNFACAVRTNSRQCTSLLQFQGLRTLYTAEALGLDGYATSRSRTAMNFHGPQMKEKFFSRVEELLSSESSNLIFSDDLKSMVNLAENKPEHLKLLNQMIERFHSQSSGLRFGVFVFGPVIMRFFHSINNPEAALSMLRNPQTVTFFDQFMSYQITMDLLLKNKMYNEVLEVFSIVQERNIQGNKFPKNCMILALAALYQMNTAESYQKMKDLLVSAEKVGVFPMRRAQTYAAALALNHNDPQFCLDIFAMSRQLNYITVRNLRVLAFAKLGRLEDVISMLRAPLEYDLPAGTRKKTLCKDTIDKIEVIVKQSGKKDLLLEFERIKKNMADKEMIEEQSLDALLDTPIEKYERPDRDTWNNRSFVDRDMVKTNFNKQERFRYQSRSFAPPSRPGLRDLE